MNIGSAYANSLLSEATYADFEGIDIKDTDQVKTALMNIDDPGKGFSESQAAEFVTHWRVANHQPDTTSGFSATLFENVKSAAAVSGRGARER